MGYVAFTRFCRESGFVANTRFFLCLVQTFTQTLKILLRFCADICSKNWLLGPLNGREFRRGKTFVLESATENALQYLGVSLSQKTLKVINSENPKIEVTGKMRQVCESKDKLAAFVKAVQNATSYEYVES